MNLKKCGQLSRRAFITPRPSRSRPVLLLPEGREHCPHCHQQVGHEPLEGKA